jgi:hypothetical protein
MFTACRKNRSCCRTQGSVHDPSLKAAGIRNLRLASKVALQEYRHFIAPCRARTEHRGKKALIDRVPRCK